MKKRILIGGIAAAIILAVIFLVVFIKGRNHHEVQIPETMPAAKHTAGEWTEGLSVTVRYGSFEEAFGVYVVDQNSLWSLEKADEALYELTESAAAGNGIDSIFELTAKQAGSGELVLTNGEKTLTISLEADEKGVFAVSGVTEQKKALSNAGVYGYDILVEKFLPGGIPDGAEVITIDLEDEAQGYIRVLLGYQENSLWYRIKTPEAAAAGAAGGEPAEGEEPAEGALAPVVYGEVVTDNGWSTIYWQAGGMQHSLESEAGQEEALTALYRLLTE